MDVGLGWYQRHKLKKAHLYSVQNGRVEHVDTGIDPVADEFDGLFDESVDHGRVGLGDNHTVG